MIDSKWDTLMLWSKIWTVTTFISNSYVLLWNNTVPILWFYEYAQNGVALIFETITFAVGCTLGLPANKLSDCQKNVLFEWSSKIKYYLWSCATKRRLLNDTRAILWSNVSHIITNEAIKRFFSWMLKAEVDTFGTSYSNMSTYLLWEFKSRRLSSYRGQLSG